MLHASQSVFESNEIALRVVNHIPRWHAQKLKYLPQTLKSRKTKHRPVSVKT